MPGILAVLVTGHELYSAHPGTVPIHVAFARGEKYVR
jgi:hypothetical protein